jgi:hypothetical protein
MENICNVKNRSGSHVVYSIPEMGVRRSFAPGEVKKVTFEELEKLTYQAGGMEILTRFLQIQSGEVLNSFNMRVEPEYHMNEQQIAQLIAHGSLDEFLDALDFAPDGVIDLIKRMSISMPLTDYNKIAALKTKTGLDVEAALKNIRAEKEDEKKSIDDSNGAPQRRVKKDEVPEGRRTAPKYNVVSKDETVSE